MKEYNDFTVLDSNENMISFSISFSAFLKFNSVDSKNENR